MVNVMLLDKRIKQSGLKRGYIADELGITRQGLYLKTRNEREFKDAEKEKLCALLGIYDAQEIKDIFLPNV